jgi:glutamate formiminotransferase
VFECVINISEGRDAAKLAAFRLASGESLRDLHSDPSHHRSVFTLINHSAALTRDVRSLIGEAVSTLTLLEHDGVHPRVGVVDVVPFVALAPEQSDQAVQLRNDAAQWMGDELGVPTFLYGPLANGTVRTLPEIRRRAMDDLAPDFGPSTAHPSAGMSAVGQREVLVAWNIWIDGAPLAEAQRIARSLRSSAVRALGLQVQGAVQVSCNLLDVRATRPSEIYDHVNELLSAEAQIRRCELVGLVPRTLLELEDPARWTQLDLSATRTIEARVGR